MELLLQIFNHDYLLKIYGLLILIAADLLLGVACAFKTNQFDLKKVANFYVSSVIPYILGYTVVHAVLQIALMADLTDLVQFFTTGAESGAYLVVFGALSAQVATKMQTLFGQPANAQ